jgi:hypothetical protein
VIGMMKIIVAAAALASVSAVVIFWSTFINVEPKTALTVETAQAAAVETATISPVEMMTKHGKNLPVEQWDAF